MWSGQRANTETCSCVLPEEKSGTNNTGGCNPPLTERLAMRVLTDNSYI